MENYETILQNYLELIEQRIQVCSQVQEPQTLYEPIHYALTNGGKRIRPLLAVLGCQSVGGDPFDAIDAGVAIEILHNFTLVHDDIMDNSPIRRGKETVHTHWDIPTAILSGDAMVGLALKSLGNYFNLTNFGKIIERFTRALVGVCEGQALDMEFNTKEEITTADYFKMIEKKTAEVIRASLVLGGLCAGAVERDIQTLDIFGENIGIAFQLQDDLLDMIADQTKLGKRIGNDILEKKKTILILKAKEQAESDEDIELISKIYSSATIDNKAIKKFDSLFQRLGIYEQVRKEIDSYVEKAIETLENLPRNEGTKMLEFLANKINERVF